MRRLLSGSIGLKVTATLVAISAFVFLYEATMFDSREAAANASAVDPTSPVTRARLQFEATAYCKGTTTASGVGVRSGVAAADLALLPVGSVLNVTTDTTKYNGIYTVMDTGPKIQGRILDLYMWSCHEALAFGRKPVQVTVLRLGWNPSASSPSLVDRLFRRREAAGRNAPLEPATLPDGPVPETATPPGARPQSNPGVEDVEPASIVPAEAPPRR
ncbi:MAG TPA: 3D domain-containing protein [Vicinamibacterales bacterium]